MNVRKESEFSAGRRNSFTALESVHRSESLEKNVKRDYTHLFSPTTTRMLPNFSLYRDTKTRHDIIDNLLIYKAIFSGIFPVCYLFCGDVSLGITLMKHV